MKVNSAIIIALIILVLIGAFIKAAPKIFKGTRRKFEKNERAFFESLSEGDKPVPLFIGVNPMEASFAVTLLERDDIPYTIVNENFSDLYPGLSVTHFNARSVLVPQSRKEDAMRVLREYVDRSSGIDYTKDDIPGDDRTKDMAENLLVHIAPEPVKPPEQDMEKSDSGDAPSKKPAE
jgi:hypothetical protein